MLVQKISHLFDKVFFGTDFGHVVSCPVKDDLLFHGRIVAFEGVCGLPEEDEGGQLLGILEHFRFVDTVVSRQEEGASFCLSYLAEMLELGFKPAILLGERVEDQDQGVAFGLNDALFEFFTD